MSGGAIGISPLVEYRERFFVIELEQKIHESELNQVSCFITDVIYLFIFLLYCSAEEDKEE